MRIAVASLAALLVGTTLDEACAQARSSARTAKLRRMIARLEPLHRQLETPQPGDWLAAHEETGQTFAEYIDIDPVTPTGRRRVIYIQPLGNFTKPQREIVEQAVEFLGLYYGRQVRISDDLPETVVPAEARRLHPGTGEPQVLTTYVLEEVLAPRLPRDAAAYLAFTANDLWPGEDWNYVFGQAMFRDRVGVWSIHRNGDPDAGADAFRICLERTLKIAAHETGHMFSIRHCKAWQCCMCGTNSLNESDRLPLHLCPECLAKVCWATRSHPIARYEKLAEFYDTHGLHDERDFCRRSIAVLTGEIDVE